MVLHGLHLLRPTLFLSGQLLHKHKRAKNLSFARIKSSATGRILYSTCISQSKCSSSFRICSLSCLMSLDLSMAFEFTWRIKMRVVICSLIWYSFSMVNKYIKKNAFSFFGGKKTKTKTPVTCSQDSSRLSFMLASRLFSSSTSLISFLRSACKRQRFGISRKHVGAAPFQDCGNNASVPAFYAAQRCWVHIQTA